MVAISRVRRIAATAMLVLTIAVPVRAGADDAANDPVVDGKSVSAWATDLAESRGDANAARAALRRAGTRAVTELVKLVEGKNVAAIGFACDALAAHLGTTRRSGAPRP